MRSIAVKTSTSQYPIWVGAGLVSRLGMLLQENGLVGKAVVVTQKNLVKNGLPEVQRALKAKGIPFQVYLVPDGETAKCEKELFKLYHALLKAGLERRDFLIAVGGGVVGDLTGFAASTYLRGIKYVQVATTLLAQVDSSIGGKTGINLGEGKNLIGAFYPPKLVMSDVEFLKTLPAREFRASLAEVIKYGVIRSGELFRTLEDETPAILNREARVLEPLIYESARIKAQVVMNDEFETKGERMILNFGHTFGHALEQMTAYKMFLHGEAVALGMIAAARLGVNLTMFSEYEETRLKSLIQKLGLAVSLEPFKLRLAPMLAAMQKDKKKSAGKLCFVLPTQIGDVLVRDDIPLVSIQKSLREMGAK